MELQEMSLQEVNLANAALREAIENIDAEIQLDVANSLWAAIGEDFRPDFQQRIRKFYDAEMASIDFKDSTAPSFINSWVREKTRRKIDEIVRSISPFTVLILINAIYFKGKWAKEFDKNETKDDTFTLLDGKKKKIHMMHQENDYRYLRGEGFQAVSLPYGQGRLSMYIFLPDKDYSFVELQKRLTAENWERWMGQFQETSGNIALPRFKVEYETSLEDALNAMGMAVAFDLERADFSGMRPTTTNISDVIHKTFADVNEEGTEAAAVAAVALATAICLPDPTSFFNMVVDRPFLCAIRENDTGAILFLGSIVDNIIEEKEMISDDLNIAIEYIYPIIEELGSFSLKAEEEMTIGRSDFKPDIKGIEKISRKHFNLALSKSGAEVIVTDTSKRGLLVNYIKVNKDEPKVCKLPVTLSLAGVVKLRFKQL